MTAPIIRPQGLMIPASGRERWRSGGAPRTDRLVPPLVFGAVLLALLPLPGAVAQECEGDCNDDGQVVINELVIGVNQLLGTTPIDACPALDASIDGVVSIDELIRAVNDALSNCTVDLADVSGLCRRPDPSGLVPCDAGTLIAVSRCDERDRCLHDADARTVLGEGSTDTSGRFRVVVIEADTTHGPLIINAALDDAVIFRVLDVGRAGRGGASPASHAALVAPSGAAAIEVVVDPSAEGAVRAVDEAGFERIADEDATDLIEETRAQSADGSIYAGLTGGAAIRVATDLAFDIFFVSPNALVSAGLNLYATTQDEGAVVAFRLDPQTARFESQQVLRDGVDGVEGLARPQDVAMSPDGTSVYVASLASDSVAAFRRDPTSGELAFVEALRDGEGGVTGLERASSVAVSPDGRHVYTGGSIAGTTRSAIAIFRRDGETGALDALGIYEDAAGTLGAIRGLTPSRDGTTLHAVGDRVVVLARDPVTGLLDPIQTASTELPVSLEVSPDGAHAYVSACVDGVETFLRDPVTGTIELRGTHSGFAFACAVATTTSPDGAHTYAADTAGAVVAFDRNGATGLLSFEQVLRNGVGGVEGLDDLVDLASSDDGEFVFAAGESATGVATFERDSESGRLQFAQIARAFVTRRAGLAVPTSIALSPDDRAVYVTSAADDAVSVLERNVETGALRFADVVRDGVDGVDGLRGSFDAVITPDGRHAYVSATVDDAVVAFQRDAISGALDLVGAVRDGESGVDGLSRPRQMTVSSDGNHVYVLGRRDGAIAVLVRDPDTGEVVARAPVRDRDAGTEDVIALATDLVLDHQGRHLYVSSARGAVAVFSRDGQSGHPGFIEVQQDGVNGVAGIGVAGSVAVSPDDAHVYAIGRLAPAGNGSIAAFRRDLTSGRLSFLSAYDLGAGTAARALSMSPEGRHVYLSTTDGVSLFSREATTGLLEFRAVQAGSDGVADTAVSADGRYVYGIDFGRNAVLSFARDPDGGGLTFIELQR